MGSGLHSCRTVDVRPRARGFASTGSRSLEHYPLHLPCQHLNEGDDDANAHDPLAIHETRCCQGLHFGCLHMTMSLVSPPLVAATEMKKGRHTPMPMVITG